MLRVVNYRQHLSYTKDPQPRDSYTYVDYFVWHVSTNYAVTRMLHVH